MSKDRNFYDKVFNANSRVNNPDLVKLANWLTVGQLEKLQAKGFKVSVSTELQKQLA